MKAKIKVIHFIVKHNIRMPNIIMLERCIFFFIK